MADGAGFDPVSVDPDRVRGTAGVGSILVLFRADSGNSADLSGIWLLVLDCWVAGSAAADGLAAPFDPCPAATSSWLPGPW